MQSKWRLIATSVAFLQIDTLARAVGYTGTVLALETPPPTMTSKAFPNSSIRLVVVGYSVRIGMRIDQ
jgi:hypothetical protein